jgi:hypothetical protein
MDKPVGTESKAGPISVPRQSHVELLMAFLKLCREPDRRALLTRHSLVFPV